MVMSDPRYQIEALESAGVPVSPRMVNTAGNLASQLAPLALRPR